MSGLARDTAIALLCRRGQLRHGVLEVGHDGVEELLAVVGGRYGANHGVFVGPGAASVDVYHVVVREVAEHTGLGLHHCLAVEPVLGDESAGLVDGAEKLVAESYLIVETREALIEPVVVARPCGEAEFLDAGVVPVVTYDGFVRRKFLYVPELTGVDTRATVVNSDAALEHKTSIGAGHESIIIFRCGQLELGRGILGADVKVVNTGGKAHRKRDATYYDIF